MRILLLLLLSFLVLAFSRRSKCGRLCKERRRTRRNNEAEKKCRNTVINDIQFGVNTVADENMKHCNVFTFTTEHNCNSLLYMMNQITDNQYKVCTVTHVPWYSALAFQTPQHGVYYSPNSRLETVLEWHQKNFCGDHRISSPPTYIDVDTSFFEIKHFFGFM